MAGTPQPAAQLTLEKGALERVPTGKFLGLRGFLWGGEGWFLPPWTICEVDM